MDPSNRLTRSPRDPTIAPPGFTLIELLVVLVIVGVVTGIAVLSASFAGSTQLAEREAKRITALVQLQCEDAVLQGTNYALSFGTGGSVYGFLYLAGENWLPRREEIYRPRTMPEEVTVRLLIEDRVVELDEANAGRPHLVCLAGGRMLPFRLRIAGEESERIWQIEGDYSGEISLEAIQSI